MLLSMASVKKRQPHRKVERRSSSLAIHNVVVAGRRTSVRLEPVMWEALQDIARQRKVTTNDLVTVIAAQQTASSLTAAIRVYILDFYRTAALRLDQSREHSGEANSLATAGC
jgi:predicted DNA-binding ribbon-helix-helix protein